MLQFHIVRDRVRETEEARGSLSISRAGGEATHRSRQFDDTTQILNFPTLHGAQYSSEVKYFHRWHNLNHLAEIIEASNQNPNTEDTSSNKKKRNTTRMTKC